MDIQECETDNNGFSTGTRELVQSENSDLCSVSYTVKLGTVPVNVLARQINRDTGMDSGEV